MTAKIKDIIKQTSFKDDYHEALIGVILLHQSISNQHNELFKSQDITMQQYNVLRILRGKYPETSSIQDIKERMIDKMSDVSRLIERLTKADFVHRTPNEIDKRVCDVTITQKGLDLLITLDPLVDKNTVLNNLNASEVASLISLIEKML
jgi:MarR family transcriptional regulator, multiple gene regulator MgrA